MPKFIREEQRDAYAVIRGFVYQVERAILTWLDLDEESVLFCECGEDIDYVRQIVDQGSGESLEERLLEQIKYRQAGSLSLRSTEIIEALANFSTLKVKNPHHQLKFRFFTNALPARERGIVFPRGLSGLEAWKQVRTGDLSPVETKTTIACIRRVITEYISTYKGSSDRVQPLAVFLSSADEEKVLKELINPIEWAMGNEESQEMQPLTKAKVLELGYAREPVEAEELFYRLFVYVFRKLSLPGEKRLDKGSLLEIVQKGTLATADRELLRLIWALLKRTDERIELVATEVASLRTSQQDITKQMSEGIEKILERVSELGVKDQPVVETMRRPVSDSPPPFPAHFTPREALARSINGKLEKLTWVALTASTGMGKTQLAKIILERWPNAKKYWISLRGRKEQLHYHVDEQLLCFYLALTGDDTLWGTYNAGKLNTQQLDQIVAAVTGRESLLVIDDLPDLLSVDFLVERLTALGTTFQDVGGKLITTSQHKLPQEILSTLGTAIVLFTVPPMDNEDIKSILKSAGAPSYPQEDRICSLLSGVTKGHPVLIAATVRWLSVNGWKIDDLNFDALLAGEPMQEARQETSRLTRRLISDVSTRELLDRLSIVGFPFDAAMALAVGNTEPAIARPKEHFYELVGPWIQPLGKSQFEVSPLLQNLWGLYLELELQKCLHITVAYEYLKRKTINANDAFQTCLHLHAAGDFKTLADFLLQFMLHIETTQQAKYFDWVQWFYAPGKEWPSAIPLGERILIRALQVRVLIMGDQNTERYETDLEHLISVAKDEDAMAIAFARFHTGAVLEQASPGLTARRAMEAARAWHTIEHKIPLQSPVPPEILFWGATTKLNDSEQIKPIIEVIRGMSEEERVVVFSSDIGPEMSVLFADSCYALEADKEKDQQDWGKIVDILGELQEIGKLSGAEPLYAASVRAHAIVLADFLNNTDEALKILKETILGLNEGSSFILISTKASILLTKKRTEEAYEYFKKALSIQEGKRYRLLLYETLKRGMMAASHTNHFENAKAWCTNGVKALRDSDTDKVIHIYEYLEMIGELAWILWASGYPKKACAAMYMIVHALVAMTNTDLPRYKETFLKTGHVLGWLASVAMKGEPPSVTVDGEPYVTPYSGIFCQRAPGIAELPTLPRDSFLMSQLAMMASGVGSLQLARKAYLMASEAAEKQGLLVYAAVADLERASIESYLGNYEAAFAAVLTGIRGVPLIQKQELETTDNPAEIWKQLPQTEKASIENFHVFHIAMLPAFSRLAQHHTDRTSGTRSLEKIKSALVSVQKHLLKYDRWNRLIGYMRLAFDDDGQRSEIMTTLKGLEGDEHYERLVLYLALACQPNAMPEEIANAQAIILSYVNELGSFDNLVRSSISNWIVKSWHDELDDRSFRLNTPGLLRRELADIPSSSNYPSDAARVLLAAEHAAGTTYDKSVREQLVQIANLTQSV